MHTTGVARPIRKPVKRAGAEFYLLVTLLSFATSVIGTRVFLALTGYPQIGGGGLHIAHVLWGGLLLFVAALLPLIFVNRWAFTLSALSGGVGVGLFIDEVGKFITSNNDYFSPLAAPIIYAFFVLTVLVYLQTRSKSSIADPRADLYTVFDGIREILDHDLDEGEKAALESQLRAVIADADAEYARLGTALLQFLESDKLRVYPRQATLGDRAIARLSRFEARWLTRPRWKNLLIVGLGLIGALAVINLMVLIVIVTSPQGRESLTRDLLVDFEQITGSAGVTWYVAAAFLDSILGTLIFFGAVLFKAGRERIGTTIAFLCLVAYLTTVNLLGFYFDQFSAVTTTLFQVVLLIALIRYRRRYLLVASASGL
ncbi:MAG: hypothetical protein K8I30_05925 [Anaerolineae bacterium]|nr:hypothetical protein [Anaerolineae bacterium]